MHQKELCKFSVKNLTFQIWFFFEKIDDDFRSAFFFFSQEKRPEVQQEHRDWKVGQVAQELGRYWKSLSEEERAIYERKAQEDKERYAEVCFFFKRFFILYLYFIVSAIQEMRNYKGGAKIVTTEGIINNGMMGMAGHEDVVEEDEVDDEVKMRL